MSGVIDRSGVFEEIQSIQIPTMVIVGDQDVATPPEKAQRIHKQISGSVLEILPRAGHSSSKEAPESLCRILDKFLRGRAQK